MDTDDNTAAIMSVMQSASEEERRTFLATCNKIPEELTAEDRASIAPLLRRLREAMVGCSGVSCKFPRVLDEDGKEYPENSAQAQTLRRIWDKATPEERAAWHLANCCMMENEREKELAIGLYMRWKDALEALPPPGQMTD